MGNLSPVAREELALIGTYDKKTSEQWLLLMKSLGDAGVLELTPDVMQADVVVRAYQRSVQLDQVEYDILKNLLNTQDAAITEWQQQQQAKLDERLADRTLDAYGYSICCKSLVEACNARHSNVHNLLSVISKAKFQNLQFMNKGMALAGFSRVARKSYGSGAGHEMEQLAKTLSEERDEQELGGRVKVLVEDSPMSLAAKDAEFTELDEAVKDGMLNDIRTPAALAEGTSEQ